MYSSDKLICLELWSMYGARFRSCRMVLEAMAADGFDANPSSTASLLALYANYLISQSLGIRVWRKRGTATKVLGCWVN